MGFFDREPPEDFEEEPEYRMPPWMGAPRGVLPGVVPLEVLVVRTEAIAVAVGRLAAYPESFSLEVHTFGSSQLELDDPFELHPGHSKDEGLQFGIEFSDGRRATGISWEGKGPPSDPVLLPEGGGGGGADWTQDFHVWPLPPDGPMKFAVEWSAQDIPLTFKEVDSTPVRDAAARAHVVYSFDHLPEYPDDDEDGPQYSIIR